MKFKFELKQMRKVTPIELFDEAKTEYNLIHYAYLSISLGITKDYDGCVKYAVKALDLSNIIMRKFGESDVKHVNLEIYLFAKHVKNYSERLTDEFPDTYERYKYLLSK